MISYSESYLKQLVSVSCCLLLTTKVRMKKRDICSSSSISTEIGMNLSNWFYPRQQIEPTKWEKDYWNSIIPTVLFWVLLSKDYFFKVMQSTEARFWASEILAYQSYRLMSSFSLSLSNVVCTAFNIMHSCRSTLTTPIPRISKPLLTAPAHPDQNEPMYGEHLPDFLMKLGSMAIALRLSLFWKHKRLAACSSQASQRYVQWSAYNIVHHVYHSVPFGWNLLFRVLPSKEIASPWCLIGYFCLTSPHHRIKCCFA